MPLPRPSLPTPQFPACDVSGKWQHTVDQSKAAAWVFTRQSASVWEALEEGKGGAKGSAMLDIKDSRRLRMHFQAGSVYGFVRMGAQQQLPVGARKDWYT